ncbi:MAG: pseudouridine-5'-phosphate glycosidase [Anaerosomatales bacterium]|nr:pseudouridine-5'-phosphate glycosidase [Anaerosomatales bacterium]MDT8433861.1 pseudouridine-5'-phosphate glycosidase [Anaerosomatales bacterium]
MSDVFRVSPEVRHALEAHRPVVALESTIITHGFPYPANLECALEAERVAREEGAVPATIGVVEGVLTVGLERADLERFACSTGIAKASRRDLPVLVARGADGGTTVAATMFAAARAGIRVFATGGIGGVHRQGERTLDISADLEELSRTDVAVVCAGAKSVLDIGLTLEYLETAGVPVVGYRADDFPAFYVPSSGFPVPHRAETPTEIARIVDAKRVLGLAGGVVVANPIDERHALDPIEIEAITTAALAQAAEHNVTGKDVTPFLLARIHEATGGASEEANRQLVYSNVRLASKIAAAL